MRHFAAIFAVAVAVAGAAPALADEATGTVSYDQHKVQVTHAYAREIVPMPEEFDNKPTIRILFADRALDDAVVRSERAFSDGLKSVKFAGFQLEVEPPGNAMTQFAIGHPQGGGSQLSGNVGYSLELSDFSTAGGMISGRLKTKEPHEFFPLPEVVNPARTFSIDVRFQARLIPAPKSDLVLTGPAALASPQAQRVIAGHALLLTGNPARIRAGLDPGHPFASSFATDAGGRAMLRQLREFGALAPLPAFRASIRRVEFRGDRAWVLAATNDTAATYTLYRTGDVWQIGETIPISDG